MHHSLRRRNILKHWICLRMRRPVFAALCIVAHSAPGTLIAQGQPDLREEVRKAFSLVGRWEIVRMDVRLVSHQVTGLGVATVSIELGSRLGQDGYFDVSPTGQITGGGEAIFDFRVEASSSGPSVQVPALIPGMNFMRLQPGAVATLRADETGTRRFTIKGTADLQRRTIALEAFQVPGQPLQMVTMPGAAQFASAAWPPMTNVSATEVVPTGAALRLRASGVLQNIRVSFEAVKYLDMQTLLHAIR